MINSADHFLGCDSVGQHMVKALDKTATVVVGSTVPINITYPDDDKFDVIDIGADKGRIYSPIRLTMDDEKDRQNDEVMALEQEDEQRIVDSCVAVLGEGNAFQGTYTPEHQNTCTNPNHNHSIEQIEPKTELPKSDYEFNTNNLLVDETGPSPHHGHSSSQFKEFKK